MEYVLSSISFYAKAGVFYLRFQWQRRKVWIEDMSGDATSYKVQLFRAPSPACSPEAACSCITHSLSFSHCKALMQTRVIQTAECVYVWTSLNIIQFIYCTLFLEIAGNYWTIMESLQLLPNFSLYRSLAVSAGFLLNNSVEKNISKAQKCDCEITPWTTQSHSLHGILQADFFFFHLLATYSWSGPLLVSL